MLLCDTWSRYLEKLQFMDTETRQSSSLRSEDVSKEFPSNSMRKDVAEFDGKYETLEMLKRAFDKYSKLKLPF